MLTDYLSCYKLNKFTPFPRKEKNQNFNLIVDNARPPTANLLAEIFRWKIWLKTDLLWKKLWYCVKLSSGMKTPKQTNKLYENTSLIPVYIIIFFSPLDGNMLRLTTLMSRKRPFTSILCSKRSLLERAAKET